MNSNMRVLDAKMIPEFGMDNKWCTFIGVAATAVESTNQSEIEVYCQELLPLYSGTPETKFEKRTIQLNGAHGKPLISQFKTGATVKASYLGCSTNHHIPDIHVGEQLWLHSYSGNDVFYWTPMGRDDNIRRFEHYRSQAAAEDKTLDPLEVKELDNDNTYFSEIDTRGKPPAKNLPPDEKKRFIKNTLTMGWQYAVADYVARAAIDEIRDNKIVDKFTGNLLETKPPGRHIILASTSKADGEDFAYLIKVDTIFNTVTIMDDGGNSIFLDSDTNRIRLLNGDQSKVDLRGDNIDIYAPNTINIDAGKELNISAPKCTQTYDSNTIYVKGQQSVTDGGYIHRTAGYNLDAASYTCTSGAHQTKAKNFTVQCSKGSLSNVTVSPG